MNDEQQVTNAETRDRLNQYHERHLKPQLKLIAEKIGITESYFVKWHKGKKDVTPETLIRIHNFLDKYDSPIDN